MKFHIFLVAKVGEGGGGGGGLGLGVGVGRQAFVKLV